MSMNPLADLSPSHPARVAARSYSLALSLSLLPALVTALKPNGDKSKVFRLIKRELGPNGFPFAIAVAVAGGSYFERLIKYLHKRRKNKSGGSDSESTNDARVTFGCNAASSLLAIWMLQRRSNYASVPKPAPTLFQVDRSATSQGKAPLTLDLTLLFLVRALDSAVQAAIMTSTRSTLLSEAKRQRLRTNFDAFIFWLASARIMWCWFYEPERLPQSYVKWISNLADMDTRLLMALRGLRKGTWTYGAESLDGGLLLGSAERLGFSSRLGDPVSLPPYGGDVANKAWSALGIENRTGIGGIPCAIVHGGVAEGCVGNAAYRGWGAFMKAILIYLPVHILPTLFASPARLLHPLPTIYSVLRSATFLSTFVSSIWFTVCLSRTLLIGRFFPGISHQILDGPYGGTLAGSLVCGASIWIEQGRRRGEMALYVLPRALRSCLPRAWIDAPTRSTRWLERFVFALSLASLLTMSKYRPESLRGLSSWTLNWVMKGQRGKTLPKFTSKKGSDSTQQY